MSDYVVRIPEEIADRLRAAAGRAAAKSLAAYVREVLRLHVEEPTQIDEGRGASSQFESEAKR